MCRQRRPLARLLCLAAAVVCCSSLSGELSAERIANPIGPVTYGHLTYGELHATVQEANATGVVQGSCNVHTAHFVGADRPFLLVLFPCSLGALRGEPAACVRAGCGRQRVVSELRSIQRAWSIFARACCVASRQEDARGVAPRNRCVEMPNEARIQFTINGRVPTFPVVAVTTFDWWGGSTFFHGAIYFPTKKALFSQISAELTAADKSGNSLRIRIDGWSSSFEFPTATCTVSEAHNRHSRIMNANVWKIETRSEQHHEEMIRLLEVHVKHSLCVMNVSLYESAPASHSRTAFSMY